MLHRRLVVLLSVVLLAGALVAVACVGNDPDATSSENADSGGGADGTGSDSNTSGSSSGADVTPSCTSPQVPCGTGCVDPATFENDSANCGTCGRSCGVGSTCTAKKCSVATILPPADAGPPTDAGTGKEIISIAVDTTGIYFDAPYGKIGYTHGSIAKCPIAACTTPLVLYNFQYADVERLLTTPAAAGFVYYTDNADDHTFRILGDGGTEAGVYPGGGTSCPDNPAHCAVDLATSGGHPFPLISDGKYIYSFRNYGGGGIGGIRVTLPSGATGNGFGEGAPQVDVAALGLALDPSDPNHRWLYIAGENGLFAVETDAADTKPVLLSSSSSWVGGIAVGNSTVLVTHAGGIRSIATCPAQASTACTPGILGVFATTAGAEAMTSDATNVYWSATGHIYACPFTGCPGDTPVVVGSTTSRVRAMTNDDKTVYWGDDNGGLYRVAK